MTKRLLLVVPVLCLASCQEPTTHSTVQTLSSPDGKNEITFELKGESPTYRVSREDIEIITPSTMGFVLQDQDSLSKNFEITGVQHSSFYETWEQP